MRKGLQSKQKKEESAAFELAHSGTRFDEISAIPFSLQSSLLQYCRKG